MEMIKTGMMIAFIAALILSIWKFYLFFPTEQLEDDDTTTEVKEELLQLMVFCIIDLYETGLDPTLPLLFDKMINHQTFDNNRFWRFNQNRLNQLIQLYYLKNPSTLTLEQIYKAEKNTGYTSSSSLNPRI